jgi:hypothetical protein
MIGLKVSALLAIVIGLGGCVLPFDDGRGRSYNRAGYYDKTNAAWRDAQRGDDARYGDTQRFEQRGTRHHFDNR